MDKDQLEAIIEAVIKELTAMGLGQAKPVAPVSPNQPAPPASISAPTPFPPPPLPAMVPSQKASPPPGELSIDLPEPTTPGMRSRPGVQNPADAEGLTALINTTSARIGVGRAGARPTTRQLLLFQSDLAVTQDALLRDVDPALLAEFNLFQVQTRVTGGKQEYLLRPDLGRQLSDDARRTISEKCVKSPNLQLCIGDGLSAAAVEANLRKIYPVLQAGCQQAGLSLGTPFFIQYCRVGVMNDIGDLLKPDVLILLIGERPGLGRAESLSAYMAYRPKAGDTDAERDVICNIYDGGGTNPLEAGAYALQLARKMIQRQASGVKLKLMET
jgi:ethanolamine ammonia-lyase small subunit